MHTILGAGGAVANALTRELGKTNQQVKLVSRKPVSSTYPGITWQKADLLNASEVSEAVKNSSTVYLTAGLPYDKVIWKKQWPLILRNVIHAVKVNNARLIFLDNVYLYGRVKGAMTEATPYNPCSVKGSVSADLATSLMNEVKAGNLNATIGRAADFYGIESMNSFLDMMILNRFAKNKSAQWVGNAGKLHSFTYVPDLGKALYLLGQHPESSNQVWHLPTAKAITGKDFIELAAKIYRVEPRYSTINRFMLKTFGLFSKPVKEAVELYYQNSEDYQFDSSKFEKAFNYSPVGYEMGMQELSTTLYRKQVKG